MMCHPCFLAVESTDRITAKSLAPCSERKPPEIFCRSFIIRPSRSARLLVNGTRGSARKRSTSGLWRAETQQQVVADTSRRPTARSGLGQRGLRFMEGQAIRDNGVVTPLDQGDQSRLQRHVLRACEVHRMAGPAQQPLHPARPVLLLDLDQRLQFAQMVRVAQRMQHAFQRVVGMPMVVHDDAAEVGQQAAAPGRDAIESEQHGRGDVQPLRLAANRGSRSRPYA